jgi:hypothetical protein
MKKIIGIAAVAAIAGALVTLARRQARRQMGRSRGELAQADVPTVPVATGATGFTLGELIAEQPEGPPTLNS